MQESETIEEAEKYILKNIRIGMRLDGLVRVDVPEIDCEEFREAIINAFCHRDYHDPDEVRIAIFPDRVEVRNPGTLMEGVTLRALKTAKVSRRRNPLIADLLRRPEPHMIRLAHILPLTKTPPSSLLTDHRSPPPLP